MTPPVTAIAPHTSIKGELRCDGVARVAGRIEGNISANDTLELAPEALVTGDIRGTAVTIHGTVKGNVSAAQCCRLGPTARVAGNICTPDLAIAVGARFIGQVCVGEMTDAPAAGVLIPAEEPAARIAVTAPTIGAAAPAETPAPTVQILRENIESVLHREPRIIRAR
jgi:cytoskeletal protein CcmA (bactofilin family)